MMHFVTTPCGPIQGCNSNVPGVAAYKGIRYATAGRWEYPKLVTHWEGIYDAKEYRHCSFQPRAFYNEEENVKKYFYYNEFRKGCSYTYSEDCLFLNVFTPEQAKEGDKLPVLVYIHGGGFTGGCGHEKHFDGPVWPTKGVIAVTLNYRLGPMGFLCLPELAEEAGVTGNYGLYDQLAALEWVKANIAAFGGDPKNITVMGQSAGAMSVQQHCLSPLSEGLFQKAVMSSGGGVSKIMSAPKAEKLYPFWQAVMERAGCSSLAELRALEPEILFGVWQEAKKEVKGGMQSCSPVIDGKLVVGNGTDILAAGKHHKIPYMVGSNSEDIMVPIIQKMGSSWCSAQAKDCYCWYFNRRLPGDDCGAWHSADLWYWFGTLANGWRPWEEQDHLVTQQMSSYLCNFVRSGDPNGTDLPQWKPTTKKQRNVLCIGEGDPRMAKPSMIKMIKTMLTNKAVGE